MSFLDRFRKKRRRLEVSVNIESDEQGPTDQQRERFRGLVERYEGLLTLIGEALWELYRPVRADLGSDRDALLGPSSASGMAERTELFGIDLRRDGGIELGYGFDRDVGWDDAMFNVALDGWTPRPVSLDD